MTDNKKDKLPQIVSQPAIYKSELPGDDRLILHLGALASPSLALAVRDGIRKIALEHPEIEALGAFSIQFSKIVREYFEAVGVCDCLICQAKAYVAEALGQGQGEAKPAIQEGGDDSGEKEGGIKNGLGHYI